MNTNQDFNRVANILAAKLLKYEPVILIVLLAAILLKYFHLPATSEICTIVLSSIAMLYFIATYSAPENKVSKPFGLMLNKLFGFSSAICVLGILFALQKWHGSNSMLTVGSVTLFLCLGYIIFQKENTIFNKYQIIRLVVLTALSAVFFYLNYQN